MDGVNSLGEPSAVWRWRYADAAGWFRTTVAEATGRLDTSALGEWTVRDLVGHTGRALMTVSDYLGAGGPVEVVSAADYVRAALVMDPAAVAERGRAAGAALGDDPVGAVDDLVATVLADVDTAPDDALVASPVGVMTLSEYLPTRTFELVVHTCDLAVALGLPPAPPAGPAESALALVGALAADRAGEVLLALTGRRPLPDGFSVLAPVHPAAPR